MKSTVLMLIAVLLGVLVLIGLTNGCGSGMIREAASLPVEPDTLLEPVIASESDEMTPLEKSIVEDLETLYADELGDVHETPDEPEMEQVEATVEETEAAAESDVSKTYYGSCRITFYCPCSQCCGSWGNATASGAVPTAGWTVANGSLPFGTKVEIDGHTYCVEDRGVGEMEMDIFVNSHQEALDRGLYYTDVWIVE